MYTTTTAIFFAVDCSVVLELFKKNEILKD